MITPRDAATRHVIDRCPSCGVEHDVRAHACEACDTRLRPWCRVHGREIGWLDGPRCRRCAQEAARNRGHAPSPSPAMPKSSPRSPAAAPVRPAPATPLRLSGPPASESGFDEPVRGKTPQPAPWGEVLSQTAVKTAGGAVGGALGGGVVALAFGGDLATLAGNAAAWFGLTGFVIAVVLGWAIALDER